MIPINVLFRWGGEFWSLMKIKLMLLPQSTYCSVMSHSWVWANVKVADTHANTHQNFQIHTVHLFEASPPQLTWFTAKTHLTMCFLHYPLVLKEQRSYGYPYFFLDGKSGSNQGFPNHMIVYEFVFCLCSVCFICWRFLGLTTSTQYPQYTTHQHTKQRQGFQGDHTIDIICVYI